MNGLTLDLPRLIILALIATYSLSAVGADCMATTPIRLNQKISASLDGSECTIYDITGDEDFTYYDLYLLTVTSATTLNITMESDYVDTFLGLATEEFLRYPVEQTIIEFNDDANEYTTNSKITAYLVPGKYIIIANSYFDFETGPYVLQTFTGSYFDLSGIILTPDYQDICAMVLASGQFTFSCNPIGEFILSNLPGEPDGTVKRQIYADGFFPKIDTLTGSSDDLVFMTRSGTCPNYNASYNPAFVPNSAGKYINIAGRVLVQNSQSPICAMVLANGQYTFSCDGTGSYALNIPLDNNGRFKLQVYADGFAPMTQVYDEYKTTNIVRMARAIECR